MTTQLKGWRRGCDIPKEERVGYWQYTGMDCPLKLIADADVNHADDLFFYDTQWYRPIQIIANDSIEPPPIQPLELPEGLRYVGERWRFLWSSCALWYMSGDSPNTTAHGEFYCPHGNPHCSVSHLFDMPPAPDNPLDHIYHRQPDGSWKRWEGPVE